MRTCCACTAIACKSLTAHVQELFRDGALGLRRRTAGPQPGLTPLAWVGGERDMTPETLYQRSFVGHAACL